MDFSFSKEQDMLRENARNFLEKECPSTLVRKLMDDELGYSPEFWRKISELGWLGMTIPEQYGGLGLNYLDLVVLMEEMGRVVLPSPFLWTLLFAESLVRAGSESQKRNLLPKIVAGELIGTLAYMEPSRDFGLASIAMP